MSPVTRLAIAIGALAVFGAGGWLIGRGTQRTVIQTATPASLVRTTVTRVSDAGPDPVLVSVPGLAQPPTRPVSTSGSGSSGGSGGSSGSSPASTSTAVSTNSASNVQTHAYSAPSTTTPVTHSTTTTSSHTQPTVQGGQHGG